MAKQIVEAPTSTEFTTYETLAYLEAYDAVLNGDYAFVAYKETSVESGEWSVRIHSSQTAGGFFDPEAMRLQSRAAGAQGKPYFVWGFNMEATADDVRRVEFRVHVANGKASSIEMFVQLRNFDESAAEPVSVSFPWPGA